MGANGQSDAAVKFHIQSFSSCCRTRTTPRDADEDSRCRLEHQPRVLQRLRRRRHARPAPQETIQFLAAETTGPGRHGIGAARFVAHVSANYRPRLDEIVGELKRRIMGAADMIILDGAERLPRYSSAEMHKFAYTTGAGPPARPPLC